MKKCNRCKKEKALSEFQQHKSGVHKGRYRPYCNKCKRELCKEYKQTHRWSLSLYNARQRCNNFNSPHYRRYGGRGIKCLLTLKEIKKLWFRDKAYLMKMPSIDRKDNDGNYTFKNCRFIEWKENTLRYLKGHKTSEETKEKIRRKIIEGYATGKRELTPQDKITGRFISQRG